MMDPWSLSFPLWFLVYDVRGLDLPQIFTKVYSSFQSSRIMRSLGLALKLPDLTSSCLKGLVNNQIKAVSY